MYRIAYMARIPLDKMNELMHKELKEKYDKDAYGVFLVWNQKEADEVKSFFNGDMTDKAIVNIAEFVNAHWDAASFDKLSMYEEKYDAKPIWKYIYTDRFLIYQDADFCMRQTVCFFEFFEELIEKYKIQLYTDEPVATLFTYVGYLVCKKQNVKYFHQFVVRGGGQELSRHYYVQDQYQNNLDFDENYMEREYSPEIEEAAEKFLSISESQNDKPNNMKIVAKKTKFERNPFLTIALYIKQRFLNPNTKDKGAYIYYQVWRTALDPLTNQFRARKIKKYCKPVDFDRKYVYYPLHYQPEASTIVCAQKYEKQLYIIDSLAKSLPADTMLYVKEHYVRLGCRDISFYEELKKFPNVVMVSPFENPFALMRNAQCVVTLTGTAGWEALLMRKPVIVLGEVYFKNAPGAIKLDDIYQNYLPAMESYVQPSREQVKKYICEYLRTSKEGNVYQADPKRHEPENIEKVTKSFVEYLSCNIN